MAKALNVSNSRATVLSGVTIAWYAFADSRDNFVKVGKAALASGVSADDLLAHVRAVHVHKCLGGDAASFDAGKVRDILALPGFETKNPDDKKRNARQQAAVDAAKVQVSRVRGALGLIAKGKTAAPEANAAQIARRAAEKADKMAQDIAKQHDKALPKFSDFAASDAWRMQRAALMDQDLKQNAKFIRGPVKTAMDALCKAIRENCAPASE